MASESPTFRPDIEGLRGVAILLVVLFHAGAPGLAGGFVGVDVFFVLSGFFITGLLARELGATESLDLRAFYGKRALRLLPPLLVVLAATLVAVMWLYAPIDRVPIADGARAVALSAGNVHFAHQSVDYFSSREGNPLLHAWSLGVEEQFYLLWPLLLLLFALGAARRGAGQSEDEGPNRALLVGIAIVGALSLGASLWLTRTAQSWAFFGMPTRLWEFALGGGLALVMRTRTWRADLGTWLQVAGLAAIGWAVATYDRATPYPGLAAVLPALGGAALLAGGRDAGGVVSRVLGAPVLRWFGRMSYAWYLWHWPLVGLGAVLHPGIGVAGRLAWSAAALVLAWLTYHTVERSSRDGWLARIPTERLSGVAFAASLTAALVAHAALVTARQQAARPEQRTFAAAREDRMRHDCWATTVEDVKGPCEFGDPRSSTVVALLGDSHAEHWLGGLDRVGRERGWKIVAMVKGGCPVADVSEVPKHRRERHYLECARYREAMLRRIVAMRPAVVLLSSWDHYVPVDGEANDWQMSPAVWQRGLRRTYARLTASGIPTVAMRGTPRTWFDVPACLSRRAARLPFAGDCTYARDAAASQVAITAQTAAARGLPVRFVDMNDQICATPRCAVVRNGTVVFTDDNHLTASFTRSLAPVLGPRLVAAAARAGARLP